MLTTDPFDADHFREECGVFGVYAHPDAAALDDAVRAGEIDVLEDAEAGVAIVERPQTSDPARADDHDLSRCDIADELGANNVVRAGLRGVNPGVGVAAVNQRSDAERIAHADDLVLR